MAGEGGIEPLTFIRSLRFSKSFEEPTSATPVKWYRRWDSNPHNPASKAGTYTNSVTAAL